MTPICVGCQKQPHEIREYFDAAAEEPEFYENAADYVRKEEGTYNTKNGHFLCTDCYEKAGCPSTPKGWIAP